MAPTMKFAAIEMMSAFTDHAICYSILSSMSTIFYQHVCAGSMEHPRVRKGRDVHARLWKPNQFG